MLALPVNLFCLPVAYMLPLGNNGAYLGCATNYQLFRLEVETESLPLGPNQHHEKLFTTASCFDKCPAYVNARIGIVSIVNLFQFETNVIEYRIPYKHYPESQLQM